VILCRVIGNSVSTVKHPSYVGHKVMVVQPVQTDTHTPRGTSFLALDTMSAGVGDLVMAAREGNTARQILGDDNAPFHAVVVGIVDEVDCP
jgi:ethanolamine utilization protein EutN